MLTGPAIIAGTAKSMNQLIGANVSLQKEYVWLGMELTASRF